MEHLFRKIIIRQRFSDDHMSINARVEAILYASEEPISASDISVIINVPKDEVIKANHFSKIQLAMRQENS